MLTRALRLVLFTCTLAPAPSSAEGITFTLSNVTLTVGGTVSGSFDYNTDTNIYSSPDVISTSDLLFSGATYTFVTDAGLSNSTVLGLGPNPTNTSDYTGRLFLSSCSSTAHRCWRCGSGLRCCVHLHQRHLQRPTERTSLPGGTIIAPEPSPCSCCPSPCSALLFS